jgi:hypothetical protein
MSLYGLADGLTATAAARAWNLLPEPEAGAG